MPFCPNCKCEFSLNIATCSDCGSALVAEIPFEEECYAEDIPAFLCSVEDGVEAEMTISLLRSNDIPVMKKRPGSGEYLTIYMGTSFYGADIYVPSKLHAKASEVLSAEPTSEPENIAVGYSEQELQRYARSRSIKRWLIIIMLLLPGVLALLVSFILTFLRDRGMI